MTAAVALATGCTTVDRDESAVSLAIEAREPTLPAEAIAVTLSDDSGNEIVTQYDESAIGDWPQDPVRHTVLLLVSTPGGGDRIVDVYVDVCEDFFDCPGTGMGIVAQAETTVAFTGGQVLDDILLVVD